MSSELVGTSFFVEDFIRKYVQYVYTTWVFEGIPEKLKIGEGDDSFVFLIPETNQVMKFYTKNAWMNPRNAKKLLTYRDITNRASEVAENEDWKILFQNSGVEAKVRINRYDDFIFSSRLNCFIGVSPYVSGVRTDNWENYKKLNTPPYFQDFQEYKKWIREINNRIENSVGVSGVDVFLMNAKFIDDTDGLKLVITDLNRAISDLRYSFHLPFFNRNDQHLKL